MDGSIRPGVQVQARRLGDGVEGWRNSERNAAFVELLAQTSVQLSIVRRVVWWK